MTTLITDEMRRTGRVGGSEFDRDLVETADDGEALLAFLDGVAYGARIDFTVRTGRGVRHGTYQGATGGIFRVGRKAGQERGYECSLADLSSVYVLSDADVMDEWACGDRAVVSRYGGSYVGKVTKVGRTRITVEITLNNGRKREHTYNPRRLSEIRKLDRL